MQDEEHSTMATLDECRAMFREHVEAKHGRIVDMAGDSVVAVFDSAADAATAVLEVQKVLAEQDAPLPEARRMRLRIGDQLEEVEGKANGSVPGDGVEAVAPLLHTEVDLGDVGPGKLHATFLRDGVFFAYVPVVEESGGLLNFLSRHELVTRDLLQSRSPYLTPLAVLVADIEDSVELCAELPPEEYFELINDVSGSMAPPLRKYYGTYGKPVGDGMVYYFFPQPDQNYIVNAIACALEMKEIMRTVGRKWRNRKNWVNDLRLNIGLDEGEEWFGTYRTPTHLEFTALGDTIKRGSRLGDFAREGTVWATKNMLGKLPSKLRETVRYGIRRRTEAGETVIMESSYSRISKLIDLEDARLDKFQDIAALPVTEVLELEREPTEHGHLTGRDGAGR
jgi:class 3 adenylate cyclase